MKGAFIFYGLSRILAFFTVGALLITALSLYSETGVTIYFLPTLALAGIGSCLCYGPGKARRQQMRLSEGAILLTGSWVVLALLGALPFIISHRLSVVDGILDSVSAVTTNGLFLLSHEETGIFKDWHILLEWMGAFIFINLFVTVMPQISKVFSIGLSDDNPFAFTPGIRRMNSYLKPVSVTFVVITLLSITAFIMAGLPLHTAVLQALTTVSTGGTTVEHLGNRPVVWACVFSMFLAGCNFLLLYRVTSERTLRPLWRNTEIRVFLAVLLGASLLLSMNIHDRAGFEWNESLRLSVFYVLSFLTTTGFTGTNLTLFPDFDKLLLFILTFVGGCVGSVTGGMKIIRFLILFKMSSQELLRTLHPQMVISVKANGVFVSLPVINRVLNVFFLFIGLFFLSVLILAPAGLSPLEALGLAGAGLTGTGATAALFGLGDVGSLPVWAKAYYCILMIWGRVEVVAFLLVVQTTMHFFKHRW